MAWRRGPTIGRGSTAAVSLATTSSGDFFAVKSTDLSVNSTVLQREESVISQLCSPFVVKYLGSEITSDGGKPVFNLFMEYLAGGTLSDQIKKRGNSLDESAIQKNAYDLAMGLDYLHRRGVVHCDIKGRNILVGDEGLKIADFGCAKWVGSDASAFAGTPAYMAPEVARGEEQGFPADVWALGCVVVEMATGSHPWPEMKDPASTLYRIAFSGDVPEPPSWFSDEAKDFVAKCLMKDPRERWTAAELLQHPFFSSVSDQSCREIRGRSPTSVTDQGFWDEFEVSDVSENPTEIGSAADSPARRITALIGDASPAGFDSTADEEWLIVRGIEIEECAEDLIQTEDVIMEEEIQTSVSMEDSLLGYSNSEITTSNSESVNNFLYSLLLISKIMLLMKLILHLHHTFQIFNFNFNFFLNKKYQLNIIQSEISPDFFHCTMVEGVYSIENENS